MKREPVESSNISSVGYDKENQRLEIEFRRSKVVYSYHKVPPKVYAKLMTAESLGKYFNENIAKEYKFTRL